MVGAFGYYSQNNSWAAGLATRLFIDAGTLRVTAAALHGDFNYDFSGIGTDAGTSGQYIPLEQKMTEGSPQDRLRSLLHVERSTRRLEDELSSAQSGRVTPILTSQFPPTK